jgi:phosphomannomutase
LSEIYSALPQFKIVKDKINLGDMDVESVLKSVREKYSDVETNDKDGLKFIWDDRWVHLRKSNTEPILRIYAEAPNNSEALNLVESVKSTL